MSDQKIATAVSPNAEAAIAAARQYGQALFKFISPNETGATGSHGCGYLLPKPAWRLFTGHPPEKITSRENPRDQVRITWQDGRTTDSAIIWYGRLTRSEYRLTRFGKGFPWLDPEFVGSLLVLIPTGEREFRAFVLETDADFEAVCVELGIDFGGRSWAVFSTEAAGDKETEDQCLRRHFDAFIGAHADFPTSALISGSVQRALAECRSHFMRIPPDSRLLSLVETEYTLYRTLERKVCTPAISRPFHEVDDFIKTAASILNRRKSRAGHSLQNHVVHLLREAGIPFDSQPAIDGSPDLVIPSAAAYRDAGYPESRLILVGIKTTCKDRWRQVLNEGRRVRTKHLLTLQNGVSVPQIEQMEQAGVKLIVPKPLHARYPHAKRQSLLSIGQFIDHVRTLHG